MSYDPAKHHRHSTRLKGYDYAQVGAYFVTVCVHNRENWLGKAENGVFDPSAYGRIVENCWRTLPCHFDDIELDAFVVMPNHFHGIVTIAGGGWGRGEAFAGSHEGIAHFQAANASPLQRPHGTKPSSLSAIMQNLKSVSARRINQESHSPGGPVWQRNYYEHVVRSEDEMNRIRQYILDNPVNWDTDEYNPQSTKDRA